MIGIGVTVLVHSQEDAVKVSEQLGRVSTGLALEGYTVTMNYTSVDDDELDKDKE